MMPYSSYVSICCDKVKAAQEYIEDTYLATLIRMQLVVCKILTVLPAPDAGGSGATTFTAAAHMAMATLRAELENLREQTPKNIQENRTYTPNYYGLAWFADMNLIVSFDIAFKCILARLYEPVIHMASLPASSLDGIRKAEAMWCCLEAVKAAFEAYASYPVAELSYLPFDTYCHLKFSLLTATRLIVIQDPYWNNKLASESLDFAAVTQRLGDRCAEADSVAIAEEWRRKRKYVNENLSVISMQREKLRWIRSFYLSKHAASNATSIGNQPSTDDPTSHSQGQTTTAINMASNPGALAYAEALSPVSGLGDEWWQAMLDDMSFFQP